MSEAKSGRYFRDGAISAEFRRRRNIFFTVTPVDRTSRALIDHGEILRAAIRGTRRAHPFAIDAVVVLPEHLHIIMTLPSGDADYSNRWRLIKSRFTSAIAKAGIPVARHSNGEYALW